MHAIFVPDLRPSEACLHVHDMVGCDRSDKLKGVLSSSNLIPLITVCCHRTDASKRALRGDELTECGSMECIKASRSKHDERKCSTSKQCTSLNRYSEHIASLFSLTSSQWPQACSQGASCSPQQQQSPPSHPSQLIPPNNPTTA